MFVTPGGPASHRPKASPPSAPRRGDALLLTLGQVGAKVPWGFVALFVAFVVLSLVRSGGDVVGSLVSAAIYSVVFLAIWRVLIWKQPTVVIDERGQRSSERNGRLTAYYRERRARQVNINGLPRSPHGPSR